MALKKLKEWAEKHQIKKRTKLRIAQTTQDIKRAKARARADYKRAKAGYGRARIQSRRMGRQYAAFNVEMGVALGQPRRRRRKKKK